MQAMLRSGLHRLLADSIRLRATGRHERAERAVKGYLEEVRTDHVKGWAFDRRQPAASPRVRVLLGNAVIAEDVATSDRPDVAKVMGVPAARCGFRVKVDLAAEALDKVAAKLRAAGPQRSFFYASGRASNEAGFLLQLMSRLFGTNYVNNCSYYCHQASAVGLGSTIGTGAGTMRMEDLEHADLYILIGANPPSNHPRLMRSFM